METSLMSELVVLDVLEFFTFVSRITNKLDRLIVLSKSSLVGWFLHVSLILIIKGRYPKPLVNN
jgi:hypothetical protein